MQYRIVSRKNEIQYLSPLETALHLSFRPSDADIFSLVERCPKIEIFQIAPSYRRQLSKSMDQFFRMNRITVQEGHVRGHRKDITIYKDIEA